MRSKDRRPKKNPEHLTPVERSSSRLENPNKFKLDVFTGVAMLWDVAYNVTKVHRFNGGTYEDQVKLVMKTAYDHKGQSELTIKEILELWNQRGAAHTRQQVQSAIHSLRHKGVVVSVSQVKQEGKAGTNPVTYGLASVIERLTSPSKELEIKAAIEIDKGEANITEADTSVGLVLTKLIEVNSQLNAHFLGLAESMEITDQGNNQMREAYNTLVTKLHEAMQQYAEIYDYNQKANNNNSEQFNIFVDNTNKNFLEIETYLKDFTQALKNLTDTNNSNFDNRYYEQQITETYRTAYREGYKDGRKDYKEEFTIEFQGKAKELNASLIEQKKRSD